MATNGHVETSEYDVIIVGAGLSGLTSAYTLLQKKPSAKVLVLEASGKCTFKKEKGLPRCSWFDWLHIAPKHLVYHYIVLHMCVKEWETLVR